MEELRPPTTLRFDLATVPDGGTERRFAPSAETRAAIAAWAELSALDGLEANIRLSRIGPDTYAYDAHFEADVVQECVVTLAPVRAHIAGDIERRYRVEPKSHRRKTESEPLSEDDEVERVMGSIVDLAAPVLEELSLAIDPYPRAPGVSFAAETDDEPKEESPFAVLEKLKSPPPARKPGTKRR